MGLTTTLMEAYYRYYYADGNQQKDSGRAYATVPHSTLEEVVSVLRRMVLGQRAEALLEAGTKADAAEEQYDIAVLQWENNKNNKNKQTKNKKKQTWTKASREEKRLLRIHSCNNRFIDLLESKPSDSEGCQVM